LLFRQQQQRRRRKTMQALCLKLSTSAVGSRPPTPPRTVHHGSPACNDRDGGSCRSAPLQRVDCHVDEHCVFGAPQRPCRMGCRPHGVVGRLPCQLPGDVYAPGRHFILAALTPSCTPTSLRAPVFRGRIQSICQSRSGLQRARVARYEGISVCGLRGA
jgi:hypothetical protein